MSNNATSLPKNTDFFDSLNVEGVRVERAWVDIGDDCFSPKSNATDLYVNTMYCNGTHGQSMGSIGQYKNEKSFIKDVHIENVWMLNGEHSARLKSWAGADVGYGFIDNVTFKNFWNGNNDYAAFLDSCYFNVSSLCLESVGYWLVAHQAAHSRLTRRRAPSTHPRSTSPTSSLRTCRARRRARMAMPSLV